nr:cytochrome c oxidase subunit II [Microcotyle caudata]
MSSNLFSFCSHQTVDNIVVYIWVLGVFISVWVILAVFVNVSYSPSITTTALSRISFEKIENVLIFFSTMLILCLITLNLLVIRSHVPVSINSYNQEDVGSGSIGVVARQWYWVYSNFGNEGEDSSIDCFITKLVDCVDNALNLKFGHTYNLNITSADVLHAFSLPAAQLKVDATPGRINSIYLLANIPGRHLGYCSEFCGAQHSYMPIVINVI